MYKWSLGKESCWADADVDTESIEGVGIFMLQRTKWDRKVK